VVHGVVYGEGAVRDKITRRSAWVMFSHLSLILPVVLSGGGIAPGKKSWTSFSWGWRRYYGRFFALYKPPFAGVIGVTRIRAPVMITQVRFQNFKALNDAKLKLGAFNVIIGPNGSGKSSVLQGFEALAEPQRIDYQKTATSATTGKEINIITTLIEGNQVEHGGITFYADGRRIYIAGAANDEVLIAESAFKAVQKHKIAGVNHQQAREIAIRQYNMLMSTNAQANPSIAPNPNSKLKTIFERFKTFSLESSSLGQPVDSRSVTTLSRDGKNLAGALTHLRDKDDDAYNQLLDEFRRWIPEYDSIGFENDQNGYRQITFRQKASKKQIHASQASEGTLLALALLTIVYQPTTPLLVGLEEPDRGLHPRLLRELRDALYRLSFPTDFGIKRAAVQVVVTTHSPFFLDLFKDHPEQVIIAEKKSDGAATFKNLSDDKELRELIGDAPLGEVWYSGVLGGVPAGA
jgi:predicted ATPase